MLGQSQDQISIIFILILGMAGQEDFPTEENFVGTNMVKQDSIGDSDNVEFQDPIVRPMVEIPAGFIPFGELPNPLDRSYYFLGPDAVQDIKGQKRALFAKSGATPVLLQKYLPALEASVHYRGGWVPWCEVGRALGYGDKDIVAAEKQHNCYILWGTHFENVHSTWTYRPKLIEFLGMTFRSSEELYQHGKQFRFEELVESVLDNDDNTKTEIPESAWDDVREPRFNAQTWDNSRRDRIMAMAVSLKFNGDDFLRDLLISTRGHKLVSIKSDRYWGWCPNIRGGMNRLAGLLEELRDSAGFADGTRRLTFLT